jgi:glycosyltransferase involved in cell wall biosynthesis
MRVAMVGPFGLHPNKTMASRALGLARPLGQRGHQVIVLMPPWQTPTEADKSWQVDGVQCRYVPLSGGTLGIARRLIQETLAWQPDVVHCFKPKAYSGLVAWWLWHFQRQRLRLVVDTDDWEGWGGWNTLAPYSPWQKWFFAWQERWGLRHCHALTVASRALQTLAWAQGVPPEQVFYVPNGASIGRYVTTQLEEASETEPVKYFIATAARPTLLLYSRLFEFDAGRLVQILVEVKRAVPDLQILMVGSGLYEEDTVQLRQKLLEAGLMEAVMDVGWVEVDKLAGVLQTADVGLYLMDDTLLNRTKCPVKLADMLAVGVPVVAEAVGQVTEYVVNGYCGRVCPSGDVAGITADLIQLLQNAEERARLSAGALAHMRQNFTWEYLAQLAEAAYA